MTKEQFENYEGLLKCKCCEKQVPKIHINYKKVSSNGEITRCNVCEWIKRHGGVPVVDGFNESEIITALYFFIYEESIYINELATKLQKTLDEVIYLFRTLKIGNKKCLVKTECSNCKRTIEKQISVYLKNNDLYCSEKCYWEDKSSKMAKGENSPFYNRIKTNCTNCNKEINVIPYNYNMENSFGDNHNFCSKECYWEYRSKYYIKEKGVMYHYEYTDEQKEKNRKQLLDRLKSDKRLDTGIQLEVNRILNNNQISYIREKTFDYYSVDNYLNEYNLILEVMGDYWHSNPSKYNKEKYLINDTQQKQLHRDKIKYSYIKKHYNINILYLWEKDINTNPKLCEELIKLYIDTKGSIPNYHSFNWEIHNNELRLKNDIVIPYQNISVDDYRNLIKKKVG